MMDGGMEGYIDGWMRNGWRDTLVEGWMDRGMDGGIH